MNPKRGLLEPLVDARIAAGISQAMVAGAMGTSQENVSRLERADDMKISTLLRYSRAIDVDLRIVGIADGEEITVEASGLLNKYSGG